jgi:hypothetical protein
MSVEDREIEGLFERSVREMRPEFESDLLDLTRASRAMEQAPMPDPPVQVTVTQSALRARPTARRSLALLGAAAVLLAGTMTVSSIRDRRSGDVVPASVPISPTEVADSTVPVTLGLTAPPTAGTSVAQGPRLSWERADAGSIARSQVTKVIAGPTGFAAIGMGFDDGANQGRVWFSANGASWEEPALDMFDALQVGGVAATRDAYFVLAGPNPDRVPAGEVLLFRSNDGRDWVALNADLPRNPQIGSVAGGLVVAGNESGRIVLRWSADGESWADSTIDLSQTGLIDLELPNDAAADVSYVRGLSSDLEELQIFSSVDGRSWSLLPAPPIAGLFAASPNGLTLIANPDEQRCRDELVAEGLQPDPNDPTWMERRLQKHWSCAAVLQLTAYDQSTQTWSEPVGGPGPSPIFAPLVWTGSVWVSPVVAPDRSMTVWTASSEGTAWRPETDTTLEFADNSGSPQPAVAAGGRGFVVVITPDRAVAGETVVLVGS